MEKGHFRCQAPSNPSTCCLHCQSFVLRCPLTLHGCQPLFARLEAVKPHTSHPTHSAGCCFHLHASSSTASRAACPGWCLRLAKPQTKLVSSPGLNRANWRCAAAARPPSKSASGWWPSLTKAQQILPSSCNSYRVSSADERPSLCPGQAATRSCNLLNCKWKHEWFN